MAQFFRLFDLPAELRYNIYHQALLPPTLHVSLTGERGADCIESFDLGTKKITNFTFGSRRRNYGSRKISFDHIFESRNKLVVEPFSISRFPINRQIYAELKHSFYTKCTWFFSSLDALICCLMFLPNPVRTKIRHLAFTFMSVEPRSRHFDFPKIKLRGRAQLWTLQSISTLLQSNLQLCTLSIHYSKLGMLLDQVAAPGLPMWSEGHKAACAVTKLVWPGVETRLLYRNAQITKDLLESIGEICGADNLEWRSRGHDRYSAPLSELLIRQPRVSSTD